MSTHALLEVRDLSKTFVSKRRRVHAVQDVSFELERGRALGLVGESGSGKSTTARMVVGLLEPSAGSIRIDGAELAGGSRAQWFAHRRRMQMIFQDPQASLDPRQTVRSILEEPLAIHRLGK